MNECMSSSPDSELLKGREQPHLGHVAMAAPASLWCLELPNLEAGMECKEEIGFGGGGEHNSKTSNNPRTLEAIEIRGLLL